MRVSLFFLYIIVGTVSFSAYSEEKPCQSKDVIKALGDVGCRGLVSYNQCCNNPQATGCLEKFRRPGAHGGKKTLSSTCLRGRPFAGQRIFNKWKDPNKKLSASEKQALATVLGLSAPSDGTHQLCKKSEKAGEIAKEFNQDLAAFCEGVSSVIHSKQCTAHVVQKNKGIQKTATQFDQFAQSAQRCADYTASKAPGDSPDSPGDGTNPDSPGSDTGSSITGGDLAKMGAAALPLLPMLMQFLNKDKNEDQAAAIDPGPCANPNLSDDEKRTLIETNQCPGVILPPTTEAPEAVEKLGGKSAELSSNSDSANFNGALDGQGLNGLNAGQQEFTGASVDSKANRRIGNGGGGGGGGPPGGGGGGGGGFGNDQGGGGGYDQGFDANVSHGLKGGGGYSNTGPVIKTGADGGYSTPPNSNTPEQFNAASYLPGGINDPNKERSIASAQIDRVRVHRAIWENGMDGYALSCIRQITSCNVHEMKLHQRRLGVSGGRAGKQRRRGGREL